MSSNGESKQASSSTQAQQCLSSNFLSKLRGPALSSTQINEVCASHQGACALQTSRRGPLYSLLSTRAAIGWVLAARDLIGPILTPGGARLTICWQGA